MTHCSWLTAAPNSAWMAGREILTVRPMKAAMPLNRMVAARTPAPRALLMVTRCTAVHLTYGVEGLERGAIGPPPRYPQKKSAIFSRPIRLAKYDNYNTRLYA